MLDPDLVGQTHRGLTETVVTQESIAAFARSLNEPNLDVAPPTYAITISLDQSQSLLQSSGLDWSRVVHGEQKFEIHNPITAGQSLRCDVTIESARMVAGNEIVTVRGDLFEQSELRVSTWSTLVFRA